MAAPDAAAPTTAASQHAAMKDRDHSGAAAVRPISTVQGSG